VALQKLPCLDYEESDVRKLGTRDPQAPGGYSADPVAVQRLCWMILPETLICWATNTLMEDFPVCSRGLERALAACRRQKEEEAEAARLQAEYSRQLAWRTAWLRRRQPLVRELWAALWNAHCGRAKSVFFAMKRIGIIPTDKIFHLVIACKGEEESEDDECYVSLEPAGAIAEEADVVLEDEPGFPIRKHATATALEAYECMRADDKAPEESSSELHRWLKDECGPPQRTNWCIKRFQSCRGRQMMLNQVFEQLTLTDLIADAVRVKIPGEMTEEQTTANELEEVPEHSEVAWGDSSFANGSAEAMSVQPTLTNGMSAQLTNGMSAQPSITSSMPPLLGPTGPGRVSMDSASEQHVAPALLSFAIGGSDEGDMDADVNLLPELPFVPPKLMRKDTIAIVAEADAAARAEIESNVSSSDNSEDLTNLEESVRYDLSGVYVSEVATPPTPSSPMAS